MGQAQAFESGEIKCLQKPQLQEGETWSFFNKLPVFRSITKLSTIHLFIHICFKHLHSNPSPTIPETFSVCLISLPAVDGSRQTDLLPVHLSLRGGEGAETRMAPSPHLPEVGRADSARAEGVFCSPSAQSSEICPCSRRRCCRRLGCLGGRLRVT